MAEEILGEFESQVEGLTLVPSGGGVFEITVDGDLVYSKAQTGEFPEYEQVAGAIRKLV
jgi:selenoprotein W-related protein